MYVTDLNSVPDDNLICFSAQTENIDLWHRRLGHVSSLLLNKLVTKNLVTGVPKLQFADIKISNVYVKEK